jgi:hypothetical protein
MSAIIKHNWSKKIAPGTLQCSGCGLIRFFRDDSNIPKFKVAVYHFGDGVALDKRPDCIIKQTALEF